MKWFGESWGAPVCDPEDHIETPVDEVCPGRLCVRKIIREGDRGISVPWVHDGFVDTLDWHLNCFLHELGINEYSVIDI